MYTTGARIIIAFESFVAPRKRWRVHLFPVLDLLIKCLVTKLQTNQNVHEVLLYVNSTEKRTGMKNTGLKMPEEDEIYV